MNPYLFIILLLTGAVCVCGCTGTPSNPVENPVMPENTPIPSETNTESEPEIPFSFEEEIAVLQNKTDTEPPVELKIGEITGVTLKENPTTGYGWNITVSPGLVIETDEYVADPHAPGIAGSGGVHHWVVRATETGNQTFEGVYRRSWEPVTGSEKRYTLSLQVTGA